MAKTVENQTSTPTHTQGTSIKTLQNIWCPLNIVQLNLVPLVSTWYCPSTDQLYTPNPTTLTTSDSLQLTWCYLGPHLTPQLAPLPPTPPPQPRERPSHLSSPLQLLHTHSPTLTKGKIVILPIRKPTTPAWITMCTTRPSSIHWLRPIGVSKRRRRRRRMKGGMFIH